ncbi:hypothetical protein [Candidatus Frankia alpina]|uniref:hypothetical protein n=1 Tax=Candidatus Frankia alpina TaxID=2699483 RepID=UPI001F345E16|nr:hypothetical protein [Candidatus Frankia alpina]
MYTNLVHVSDSMWGVFARPGVGLATSSYSSVPAEHEQVTGRRGSHARTRENIIRTLQQNIPLSVGLIDTGTGDVSRARAELLGLGVTNIRVDKVRAFGRAAGGDAKEGGCENCGLGRAAVQPDGRRTPCVMVSDCDGGNILDAPLADLLTGQRWLDAVGSVPRPQGVVEGCVPNDGSDLPPRGRDDVPAGLRLVTEGWQLHARALADTVTHPGSRWYPVVAGTPRHELVPAWWARGGGEWVVRRGPLADAYADRSLVTRVGIAHADHAAEDDRPTGRVTSSSTLPSLVTATSAGPTAGTPRS